jgi:glycosyltransferase involved in cell wall biosynthesis
MKGLKILFITPKSTRSGAPLLLLNFIKWAVEKELVVPLILFSNRGSLDEEFKRLGETFFYYENILPTGRGIFQRVYIRLYNSNIGKNWYLRRLRSKLLGHKPDLVYSNTIANGAILDFCRFLDLPVISHVHESSYLTNIFGEENISLVKQYSTFYIACSKYVMHSLVENFEIPVKDITVIYSSVSRHYADAVNSAIADSEFEKARLNGKVIIGGSGGAGWIKGSDLVIPLMKRLLSVNKNICFLWVGGDITSNEYRQLEIDIRNANLENNIIITGLVDNPWYYFSLMNIFVLLSREDSFPLVCLENALISNPIVCFENAGGAVELLANWPDNILPYLDIDKMAERVSELLNNQLLAAEIGNSLRKRVLENFTSELLFSRILETIQQQLASRALSIFNNHSTFESK